MWNYVKDNKYPILKDGIESDWVLCAMYKFGDESKEPEYICAWWDGKKFENYEYDDLDVNPDYYHVVKWMYIPD